MTPDEQRLLAEVQAALAPLPPSLRASVQGSDLFEAYLFTLVVEAARGEGATVTFETVGGTSPKEIFLRTSPGHIYSALHQYTHAVIDFAGRPPLEGHVGIRVAGKSQVLHEWRRRGPRSWGGAVLPPKLHGASFPDASYSRRG